MAKSFFETIIARGGFAGESFDVAAGPANTGIVDVLLSAGDGTVTIDAPIFLESTGALGAARDLDITALEVDEAGDAVGGRIFYLSVRNSDITTNNLTVTGTTSFNGTGGSFTIDEASDWLFIHGAGGAWRALRQQIGSAVNAMVFRATFAAADWTGGTANQINIVQTGAPGAGEIGPHGLAIASSYIVQAYRDANDRLFNVGVEVDPVTGDILLRKAPAAPNIAGRVIVIGV